MASASPSAHRAAVCATARPSLRACESGIRTQPRPGVLPGAPSTRLRTGPSVRGVRRECGCRESHVQRSLARIIVPPMPIRRQTAVRRKTDKQQHESRARHTVPRASLMQMLDSAALPGAHHPRFASSTWRRTLTSDCKLATQKQPIVDTTPHLMSRQLQVQCCSSRRRPTIPGGVSPKCTDRALEAMRNTRRMSGRSASELAQSTTVHAVKSRPQAAPAAAKWAVPTSAAPPSLFKRDRRLARCNYLNLNAQVPALKGVWPSLLLPNRVQACMCQGLRRAVWFRGWRKFSVLASKNTSGRLSVCLL